jgi:hypothetical protein
MKNIRKLIPVLLLSSGALYADVDTGPAGGDAVSQTFLWIRPQFQTAMPEKESGFRYRALDNECGAEGALQFVLFGGRSSRPSHLAKYFMFNNKTSLVVASDRSTVLGDTTAEQILNASQGINRDINPFHFNIIPSTGSAFASTIAFSPRQSVIGFGIEYRQYLGWSNCEDRKWWLNISTPLTHVRNKVNLVETLINPEEATAFEEGSATSMTQAFQGQTPFVNDGVASPVWQYGKINDSEKMTRTRLADIEVRLGYDYIHTDCVHFDGYLGIIIPTGNKPNAEFLFEPIVGNAFHFGFMSGGAMGFEVWNSCDKGLRWEFALNSRYLVRNTQTRMFDVYGKPWSRYMAIYANDADRLAGTLSSGINFFTQKVRVHPRFQFNATTALLFEAGRWQLEAGYNFWAKQGEKVRLDAPWQVGPSFANIADGTIIPGTINRASLIGANFDGAAILSVDFNTNQLIQQTDLNLGSAANPGTLSHTFYGYIGADLDCLCVPAFIGLGGGYEFNAINTAISRWNLWGKFGFSF